VKRALACLTIVIVASLCASPTLGAERSRRSAAHREAAAGHADAPGARAEAPARVAAAVRDEGARGVQQGDPDPESRRIEVRSTATDTAAITSLPEHVLFIGNSHTERFGGMDWLVGNLVAAEDPPRSFEGERETASGVTLEYHYHNGAIDRIWSGDWDVVVLQEYLPGITTQSIEPFREYAGLLDAEIRASGARTVLYMTWPQARYDWADIEDFVDAYRAVSVELGVPVAPVGVAMERARAERPDIALIEGDEVHATWQGAYLAAATIYATLFQRSPEGLPYTFGISEEDADFLQRIAWETVTAWQAEVAAAE
jgi:hypothetical protein